MIRRTIRIATATLALASPLLMSPAAAAPVASTATTAAAVSPVQASSFGPCYALSGFSFKHKTSGASREGDLPAVLVRSVEKLLAS